MIRIVCEREGESITFAHALPYWIRDLDGITDADYDVTTSKPTGYDGEIYQGSTANKRNIVIKATCKGDHDKIRDEFFSFFEPRATGTLYFYEGDTAKKIDYITESCEFEPDGRFRVVTVSLICPDPKFKALEDESVTMAEVTGLIEWPVELPAEFEVGIRAETLMATIVNPSNVDRGLTIRFEASGEVVNPGMVEVTRQESLRVLTTLHAGEVLTVTTGDGEKRVKLTRGTETTNVNNLWEFGGVWLKAEHGTNIFRYTADQGGEALTVTITSTPAYWGA